MRVKQPYMDSMGIDLYQRFIFIDNQRHKLTSILQLLPRHPTWDRCKSGCRWMLVSARDGQKRGRFRVISMMSNSIQNHGNISKFWESPRFSTKFVEAFGARCVKLDGVPLRHAPRRCLVDDARGVELPCFAVFFQHDTKEVDGDRCYLADVQVVWL